GVDVAGPDPGLAVEALRDLLAPARGVELVGDVGVRERPEREALRRALLAREDLDRSLREVSRALPGGHHQRAGAVALEAAVEQAAPIPDHRRRLVIGERHRLAAHHRAPGGAPRARGA